MNNNQPDWGCDGKEDETITPREIDHNKINILYNIDILNALHYLLKDRQYNEIYSLLDKKKLRYLYKEKCPCGGLFQPKFSIAHLQTRRHRNYVATNIKIL